MKKLLALATLAFAAVTAQAAMTWHWVSVPSDTAIRDQIAASMNTAVGRYNTYANYGSNVPVEYVPGVPTAQASWGWRIQFGGSRNARVAQHELAHYLAIGGGHTAWNNNRSGNTWTGVNGNARVKAFDGDSATLGADTNHFWPYGWNYDSEGTYPERNIGVVGAMRKDMGLDDPTIGIAPGTYRLVNRASGRYLDNYGATTDGATVRQHDGSSSNNQKWVVTIVSGTYFKLQCVTGGKYLDTLGNTANDTPVGQWSNGGSNNQQWTLTQTDSGYFKLINRGNGKCLDTGGATANGTVMENWSSGSSHNQQWKFVK